MTLGKWVIKILPDEARRQRSIRRHFVTKFSQELRVKPNTSVSEIPPQEIVRIIQSIKSIYLS